MSTKSLPCCKCRSMWNINNGVILSSTFICYKRDAISFLNNENCNFPYVCKPVKNPLYVYHFVVTYWVPSDNEKNDESMRS